MTTTTATKRPTTRAGLTPRYLCPTHGPLDAHYTTSDIEAAGSPVVTRCTYCKSLVSDNPAYLEKYASNDDYSDLLED